MHGLDTLAVAALLMTLQNPLVLCDVRFELTSAATLGLIPSGGRFQTRGNYPRPLPYTTAGRARTVALTSYIGHLYPNGGLRASQRDRPSTAA